jgi:hypothetical protein
VLIFWRGNQQRIGPPNCRFESNYALQIALGLNIGVEERNLVEIMNADLHVSWCNFLCNG